MLIRFLLIAGICGHAGLLSAFQSPADPDAAYVPGPESQRQAGVPEGSVTRHELASTIFDGTQREYFVYVPKQYDGTQPACVMVFQDGHAYADPEGQFRVPVVLDNLIHKRDMPVTVGVFVNPGHRGETPPENRWRANHRSAEYDTLSDRYAKFIHIELLPRIAADLKLKLSNNAQDRAICGISSGGICAFTAAWEHPEWFSKVLSHVGSFTNIRGGHNYEALIRKSPVRPIRVFLQDGENDLDNEHGNWWLANLQMDRALRFRGYDCKFVGGTGGHNGRHGGAILPESLKWLWRDHVVGRAPEDSQAVNAADAFESRSVQVTAGEYEHEEFRYRLLKPTQPEPGKQYPLVVFLHGAGERGIDNEKQLLYLPAQLAQPPWRSRFPCFVLAPQCRPDRKWLEVDWSAPTDPVMPDEPTPQIQAVIRMIEQTLESEPVDRRRIYLTGLSMGGFGTFDLAIRRPELFAALAPVCGAADVTRIAALSSTPVWLVHGDDDKVVPVERSRAAFHALRSAGADPVYVELPGIGHNSWTPGYEDYDGLLPWLFRQVKAK